MQQERRDTFNYHTTLLVYTSIVTNIYFASKAISFSVWFLFPFKCKILLFVARSAFGILP